MDTFRDISAEEAKLLAIQFIGQQMGEIKDLNSRVINDSATLQRVNVDVNNIIKSIPSTQVSNQTHTTNPDIQLPRETNPVAPAPLDTSKIPLIEKMDAILAKLDSIINILNKA